MRFGGRGRTGVADEGVVGWVGRFFAREREGYSLRESLSAKFGKSVSSNFVRVVELTLHHF